MFQLECVKDDISLSKKENHSNKEEMFVTVTLNGCSQHSDYSQEIILCGTKGHLILRNEDLYFRKKNGVDATEEAIFIEPKPSKRSDNNNKISSSDCARSPEMFPKGTSLLFRHLSNTLKSTFKEPIPEDDRQNTPEENIDKHAKSLASFEDGLYVQAVMEAIRLSSRQKSWTKVNVVDDFRE